MVTFLKSWTNDSIANLNSIAREILSIWRLRLGRRFLTLPFSLSLHFFFYMLIKRSLSLFPSNHQQSMNVSAFKGKSIFLYCKTRISPQCGCAHDYWFRRLCSKLLSRIVNHAPNVPFKIRNPWFCLLSNPFQWFAR